MESPLNPGERPLGPEAGTELPPPPTTVGRYAIERQLGRGAFANVYLARAPGAWAPVALKVLHSSLDPSIEAQARVRFLAEERITNAIDDVRVVHILEASAEGERPCYLAMQYVDGESFTAAVTRKRHAEGGATHRFWQHLARLGYEVAQAMAKAHARGIVHRDLKPDNVLVNRTSSDGSRGEEHGPNWLVKIVDFGIAKAPAQLFSGIEVPMLNRHFTVLGTVMGSPPYMAPEQNGAAHSVTGKADVFALGVLLSIAALNLDPDKLELGDLGLRALQNFASPLSQTELPESWCPLLSSMLAVEAEARPNMRDVAIELGRLSQGNAELGRAVHAWLKRASLPSGKTLAKLSRVAPPEALWTDDEREFLLKAPLMRLERPKGRRLRALGLSGLLAATGALGVSLHREHGIANDLEARLKDAASEATRARALAARVHSASAAQVPAAITQAAHSEADREESHRSQTLLAKTARENAERRVECRATEQQLGECISQRRALDERRLRAEQRAQASQQELETCQKLIDRNEDAAQVCRRELDARSEELTESSSRIRLCMESLRARRSEASADVPGDG